MKGKTYVIFAYGWKEGLYMNKSDSRKASRLSLIDRKVLTVYSDISLETGARIPETAGQAKSTIHKAALMKI